ncbi:MAG: ABC transporter permease [Solobacterium sp.]|nr:ABC transporter permease [Solobacterium sp.]
MKNKSFVDVLKRIPPVLYMLLLMIIIFSVIEPNYLSSRNFKNILVQCVPLMIMAFAQTVTILTEGIDMSLNAVVNIVTVLSVWLATKGVPLLVAMFIAVLVAILIGVIKGFFVAKFSLPPFIVTYGMQNIVNSIALLLTAGASIYFASTIYQSVTKTLFIVPGNVYVAILMFIITYVMLKRTKLGANIRALGGNPESLTLAGVNPNTSLIKAYAFAGFLTGIAGLMMLCRVESGQPIVANGLEFQAVAATVLGGTSLCHGKGNVTGTILGVLLIQVIQNGLNVIGVPAIYQSVSTGGIVLTAIIINALISERKAK